MDKIKTSELISKLALASEKACKCEDENFWRIISEKIQKKPSDPITFADAAQLARATTDFSRFAAIREICKVLQELDLIENDTDVFNNDEFREIIAKTFM